MIAYLEGKDTTVEVPDDIGQNELKDIQDNFHSYVAPKPDAAVSPTSPPSAQPGSQKPELPEQPRWEPNFYEAHIKPVVQQANILGRDFAEAFASPLGTSQALAEMATEKPEGRVFGGKALEEATFGLAKPLVEPLIGEEAKDHPVAATAGSLTGGVGSLLMAGGALRILKLGEVAEAAGQAATKLIPEGEIGSRLAASAVNWVPKAIMNGATFGTQTFVAKTIKMFQDGNVDLPTFGRDVLQSTAINTAAGGALGVIGRVTDIPTSVASAAALGFVTSKVEGSDNKEAGLSAAIWAAFEFVGSHAKTEELVSDTVKSTGDSIGDYVSAKDPSMDRDTARRVGRAFVDAEIQKHGGLEEMGKKEVALQTLEDINQKIRQGRVHAPIPTAEPQAQIEAAAATDPAPQNPTVGGSLEPIATEPLARAEQQGREIKGVISDMVKGGLKNIPEAIKNVKEILFPERIDTEALQKKLEALGPEIMKLPIEEIPKDLQDFHHFQQHQIEKEDFNQKMSTVHRQMESLELKPEEQKVVLDQYGLTKKDQFGQSLVGKNNLGLVNQSVDQQVKTVASTLAEQRQVDPGEPQTVSDARDIVRAMQSTFNPTKEVKMDERGIPVRRSGSVVSTVETPEGRQVKITHQMVLDEAQGLLDQAKEQHEAVDPVAQFVRDNGGIRGFKGGIESEEFKNVPIHVRGQVAADEMAQMAYDRNLIEEPDADLLRNHLASLEIKGPEPQLAEFYDQAQRNLEENISSPVLTEAALKTGGSFTERIPANYRKAVERGRSEVAKGTVTKKAFTDEKGDYTPQRQAIHQEIVQSFEKPEAVASPGTKPRATIVIGPPGSGKSTAIEKISGNFVTVDNDLIKEKLPGFKPSKAALYHAESADVEASVIKNIAQKNMNFVYSAVGRSEEKFLNLVQDLKAAGYGVDLVHMKMKPEDAALSVIKRYMNGGRFVDPDYVLKDVGLKTEGTYGRLKPEVENYEQYQASVTSGKKPRLLETSDRRGSGGLPGRSDLGSSPGSSRGESPAKVPSSETSLKTNTPEFKKWFGDSKVVDEKGQPLIVYHGTHDKFSIFKKEKLAEGGAFGSGFYFTNDKQLATQYAGGKEPVAAFLSVKNPFVVDLKDKPGTYKAEKRRRPFRTKGVSDRLKAQGYDGVLIKQGNYREVVVFEPTQIKSATGNRGTFDPSNPNINFMRASGSTTEPKEVAPPKTPRKITPQEVQDVSSSLEEVHAEIQAIINPTNAAPLATQITREQLGIMARSFDKTEATLEKAKDLFDRQTKEQNSDFIDRMEHGVDQSSPELQSIAETLRNIFDAKRDEVRDLGQGKLKNFIENYFPHVWEQGEKEVSNAVKMAAKRPFEGQKGFLKKRTIEFFKEGLERGLTPVSYNPVELTLLKIREMDKYLAAHRTIKAYKENGLAQYVAVGKTAPEGWMKINDGISTVFKSPMVAVKEAFDEKVMDDLTNVAQGLDIDLERSVRMKGEGKKYGDVWGLSQSKAAGMPGKIFTRFAGPESAMAHELGHQIDNMYGLRKKFLSDEKIKDELSNLADKRLPEDADDKFKEYVQKPEEQIAALFESYIHAPELLKEVAPTAAKKLTEFLNSNKRLKPLTEIKPSLVMGTGESEVYAGGNVIAGHIWAQPDAARIINNYLSPGLQKSALYRAFRFTGNALNQFQLGFSAFHLGFTSMDAIVSKSALALNQLFDGHPIKAIEAALSAPFAPVSNILRGDKLFKAWRGEGQTQMDEIMAEAMASGGGRARMDQFYATKAHEEMKKLFQAGKPIQGVLKTPLMIVEAGSKPILEYIVPRQKLGIFADIMKMEIENNPNMTHEEMRGIAQKAWDSVDNRMGQLVYDNLFWNRTFKDLLMASVRSVGWNLGTIREIAGGAADMAKMMKDISQGKKSDLTYRSAYLMALPIVAGLFGAIYQYLRTGKGPEELKDYYFPKTGGLDASGNPNRVDPPTYMKDIYHYGTAPFQTALNKLNPLLAIMAQMYQNKDYYGVRIRNQDDPLVKQALQEVEFIGKQLEPFGFRNMQKQKEAGNRSLVDVVQPWIGITPAPWDINQTKAEKLAHEISARKIPIGGRTQEQADRSALLRQLENKFRMQDPSANEELVKAFQEGKISATQMKNVIINSRLTPLQRQVNHFNFDEIKAVYDRANPDEKQQLERMMQRKEAASKRGWIHQEPN